MCFLHELSAAYPDDDILLSMDGASWHKTKGMQIPSNIELFFLPPYTPEMNPIEQIWSEIRKRGFRNEIFPPLEKVIDRLCHTTCSLSNSTIRATSHRSDTRENMI